MTIIVTLVNNVYILILLAVSPAVLLLEVGVSLTLVPDVVAGLVVGVSVLRGSSVFGGPVMAGVSVSGSVTSLLYSSYGK